MPAIQESLIYDVKPSNTEVNTPTHAVSSDSVSTQSDTLMQAVSAQLPKQIEQVPISVD